MTLRNIRTGQQQFFHFPTDITDEPEILHRIFHIPGFAEGCFTFPRGWFSQFTEHLSIIVYGEKINGVFRKFLIPCKQKFNKFPLLKSY